MFIVLVTQALGDKKPTTEDTHSGKKGKRDEVTSSRGASLPGKLITKNITIFRQNLIYRLLTSKSVKVNKGDCS